MAKKKDYSVTVIGLNKLLKKIRSVRTNKVLTSTSFNKGLSNYRTALINQIKKVYTIRYSFEKIKTFIKTDQYNKQSQSAQLIVKYAPTPLAHFLTVQTRIGKKGVLERIFPSQGIRFQRQKGSGKPHTSVRVIRATKKYKLVRGRHGHKGFLQHRKFQIYERLQRATWRQKNIRAPYKPLYSLSVSQMARSRKVHTNEFRAKQSTIILKRLTSEFKELLK